MSQTKVCKICAQEKPFDPTQKRESKANGFVGNTCVDCARAISREIARQATGKPPEYFTERKARALARKALSTGFVLAPVSPTWIEAQKTKLEDAENLRMQRYTAWAQKQEEQSLARLLKQEQEQLKHTIRMAELQRARAETHAIEARLLQETTDRRNARVARSEKAEEKTFEAWRNGN